MAQLPKDASIDLALVHVSSIYGNAERLEKVVPELRKILPGLGVVIGCSSAGVVGMKSRGRPVEVWHQHYTDKNDVLHILIQLVSPARRVLRSYFVLDSMWGLWYFMSGLTPDESCRFVPQILQIPKILSTTIFNRIKIKIRVVL